MSGRADRRLIATALAALAAAGCGGGTAAERPHVLRLASAEPAGIEHEPAVAFFARRVEALSHGRLRIAVDERWARSGTAVETDLLRDVAHGAADLGWAHTRSFDRAGMTSFTALDAPGLIDRYDVEAAVVSGPLAAEMLAGVRRGGLRGLALLAGPLTRTVGLGGPLRGTDDLRRRVIAAPSSSVTDAAVRALGAFPRPPTYNVVSAMYADGAYCAARPGVLEADLDALFFDRLGSRCAAKAAGRRRPPEPWVTTNAVFGARTAALVANPGALRGLRPRERAWIAAAAAEAVRHSTVLGDREDRRRAAELCAAGVRFAAATPAMTGDLRRAWAPLYARLAARPAAGPAIRRIEAIRDDAPAATSLRVPGGCDRPQPAVGHARGVPSGLPDGVYRIRLTKADLAAAGADPGDRTGVVTLTLRGGRWHIAFTEPARAVRTGTYAGTGPRTVWQSTGSAGRDEAYVSVAVDNAGSLRFHVARAGDLASAQALYATHRWRRIAP